MIPKTQSVCTCKIVSSRQVEDGECLICGKPFETVAEPASTGEPPICPICESTESPHAVGISCNLAARPSEPSLCDKPQVPGPADAPCGLDKGHPGFCRPSYDCKPSAHQANEERIITAPGLGVIVPLSRYNDLIDAQRHIDCLKNPQESLLNTVAKYLEHGLTVSHKESAIVLCDLIAKFAEAKYVQPSAPQPVSDSAPMAPAPAQGTPEPPKVEEIAWKVVQYFRDLHSVTYDQMQADIAAILRPYFHPASQTPQMLKALKDLVRVIRDFKCGDYSPIMDEIFDAEAAIREEEKLAATPAQRQKRIRN